MSTLYACTVILNSKEYFATNQFYNVDIVNQDKEGIKKIGHEF